VIGLGTVDETYVMQRHFTHFERCENRVSFGNIVIDGLAPRKQVLLFKGVDVIPDWAPMASGNEFHGPGAWPGVR
jgi:hypothetical protein